MAVKYITYSLVCRKDSEHNQNIVVWTIQNFDCMRFLQGYVTDNPLLARHIPRQYVDENEKLDGI